MKTITVIGVSDCTATPTLAPWGGQDLVIAGPEEMSVSDGFHTFEELYDHRITLYVALCRLMQAGSSNKIVWRSKLHSDGLSLDGWFILGIGSTKGYQISYHLPLSRWAETDFAETLEKGHEWDGHTSNDVLARLKQI